jgi:uncharacterized membrane protein
MSGLILLVGIGVILYFNSELSALRREVSELRDRLEPNRHKQPSTPAVTASLYGEEYSKALQHLQRQEPDFQAAVPPLTDEAQPVVGAVFAPHNRPYEEPQPSAFMVWLQQDTLMKIGAFLVLLALGWFVSYAFMNNWIGPMGRIMLGVGAGIAVYSLGVWRMQQFLHQGVVLLILGGTTILMSLAAARYVYDFLTPGTALLFMFIVVAFTALLSVQHKVESLAVVSLCAGVIAPFLADTTIPDAFGLFSYLGIVFAGALVVASLLPSRVLTPVALAIASLFGFAYMDQDVLDRTVAMYAAFIYCVAFLASSTAALMREQEKQYGTYITTALGVGVYMALWITVGVDEAWQGFVYVLWSVGFLSVAAIVYQGLSDRLPAYVHTALGLAGIALATAEYLDGTLLLLAWFSEITAMVMVALWGLRNTAVARGVAWLYIVPIFLSLEHVVSSAWNSGVMHVDMFVLVLLAAVFFFVGSQFVGQDDNDSGTTLISVGVAYSLTLVWLVTHALLIDSFGTLVSLVIYTVIGLALYIGSTRIQDDYAKYLGLIMIGGVVTRLLLVDIWDLELVVRIIVFFIIGVLLISTAFLAKKQH